LKESSVKSVCVYCGSNPGQNPAFVDAARHVGQLLAERDITLVYGGGRVGLMGEVADAALAAGGKVIGVIPQFMAVKEVAHMGLSDLHVVQSMHARKAKMEKLSDAFIALPGGIGTMEELFEIWTWAQLGQHEKPVGLLDVDGYYAHLVAFLKEMTGQGFLQRSHHNALQVADTAEGLLSAFERYEAPEADVRLKTQQT
jgi:uncharacterized protein (TIGR00730 family)